MLIVNTVSVLICLIGILLFSTTLESHLNFSFPYQMTAIVLVWFTAIGYANLVLWRCEEKPLRFGLYNISSSLINALFTIILVVILVMGWQGRALSIFLSSIIMGVISLVILYKKGYLVLRISKEYIKSVLIFSIPIIPHALSFWIKSGADKIMLTDLCGLAENGLYSVAVTWGAIVSMVMVAFSNSYSPWLFKKLAVYDKDKEGTLTDQKRLVKIIYLSLIVIFVIVFFLYIISHILIGIMYPESYSGSKDYLPYVMISQAFNGAYLLFVCFLHYTFKTKILGITTFTLSLVQIALAYFLIKQIGPMGVAYSSVIGSFLTFIVIAFYGITVKGSGDRFCDFVYIDDIVDAVLKSMNREKGGMFEVYNVSNCRKVHVKDIVAYIEGHLPYKVTHEYVEGTPGDQNGVYGVNDKIKHDLGWEGKVSFEEGMQRMIDWALK